MPNFMPTRCLVLIWWTFFISEPDKVHHRSRVVGLTAPVDASKLVLMTYYDVSVASRLTNNI